MRISEVINRKGSDVVSVAPDVPITELLSLLAKYGIGAVVVSDDEGQTLTGIVSERDVVRALNEEGSGVLMQPVSTVMTTDVHTCKPEEELEALAIRMTEFRVRHVPVVEDGKLVAIVSIGDVVKHRLEELQEERDHLVDYVQQS